MKYFSDILTELEENNQFSSFLHYKSLSPKMKDAVEMVYLGLENDSDIVVNLENRIIEISKEIGINEQDLLDYFENEEII